MKKSFLAVFAVCALRAEPAQAVVQITEWMYNPLGASSGEFVEITNRGAAAVDMTNWSFDDSSRTAGSFSLASLGLLGAGESALITELTAANFRTEWGLAAFVKVVGGNTQNLSRGDEINIYDASSALVDRLTYDDQGSGNVDGPRTQGISGNPPTLAALGANNASLWVLSTAGDAYGSAASVSADIGNPGKFLLVPEPAGAVIVWGLAALLRRRG
jgi:predicted extracellular nuclease